MKIHLGIKDIEELNNSVVTSGTFDGVHFGHQKILARLREAADEINGETVVITYWPHPRMVLKPWDPSLKLLSTFPEKATLLEKYGVDHLVKIPFTQEFAQMSSEEYIRVILSERVHTKRLIIGYDHHFGKNREGNLQTLQEFAPKYDFEVEEIPRLDIDAIGVSSTKIRRALEIGDVKTANEYLGRPYSVSGMVVHGKQLGRTIGYPTANIQIKESYKLIPADGIYAVKVCNKYQKRDGMLNIGHRPTVGGDDKTIEVHIFDFSDDIYDSEISIEFIDLIRKEEKFNSVEELKAQLQQDEIAVKARLAQFSEA
uniref:bifunctional riboflavin kinase/FAD synthetase n=1 Tax=Roseivirga sp. TaxID=1964215 RepID=UPI004047F5B9